MRLHYMTFWKEQNSRDRKPIGGFQDLGKDLVAQGQGIFHGEEPPYVLIVVIYVTVCNCQNLQNCKLKQINSPVNKL